MMRFGTIVGFQNPPAWHRPWEDLYAEGLAFAVLADELGLHEVWLTEHHVAEDGYCPALLPVAAAIAVRTERVRIGTKALLLPLHHPLRVAEDAAVVDLLSRGRLDLGVAAGYRSAEFEAFRIPMSERSRRMDEGLSVLRRALDGESFELGGRLMPPTVQRPFPLWMGGRSAAAMRRAAREGCHLMLADFILSNAKADHEAYVEALVHVGRDPSLFEIVAVAAVFVDEDHDRAWATAGPHLLYQQNQYRSWFTQAGDRESDRFAPLGDWRELENGAYLIGTPDEVRGQIARLHSEVPFTQLSFWTLLPGMPVEHARRSLELFASEVMPTFSPQESSSSAHRVRPHRAPRL